MKRNILVGIACALLSFLLLSVSVFFYLRLTNAGRFAADPNTAGKDYETIKAKYGDPWLLMEHSSRVFRFLIIPLIAAAVGVFAGFWARNRPALVGFLGMLPLGFFVATAHGFSLSSIALLLGYSGLSSGSAALISMRKTS